MPGFEELTSASSLNESDQKRLQSLIAEWQLLADLSFADLLLWVPIRETESSWPEGHVASLPPALLRPPRPKRTLSQLPRQ